MTTAKPIRTQNIADPYRDLLAKLDDGRRLGLIRRLAVGYYDGWQPTRAEISSLIDFELGRITEDEYLASNQPTPPVAPATRPPTTATDNHSAAVPSASSRLARRGLGTRAGMIARAEPPELAAFAVDCGQLAPPFRFVARGLSSDGSTLRGGLCHQLMTLHYELILPSDQLGKSQREFVPVIFSAAVVCVPDRAAPWSEGDGRSRRHAVRNRSVVGSRGPWPLAEGVRRVVFLICEQSPPGARPIRHPAGSLQVDIKTGTAVWRPVTSRAPVAAVPAGQRSAAS